MALPGWLQNRNYLDQGFAGGGGRAHAIPAQTHAPAKPSHAPAATPWAKHTAGGTVSSQPPVSRQPLSIIPQGAVDSRQPGSQVTRQAVRPAGILPDIFQDSSPAKHASQR